MPEVNGIRVPFIPAGGESQLQGVKSNKVSNDGSSINFSLKNLINSNSLHMLQLELRVEI